MTTVIPTTLEEIGADWVSAVLGADVFAVRVADAHEGTTGRGLVRLDAVPGSGVPAELFVKLPPTVPSQRQFVVSSGMGRREALFYQQLGSSVPIRVPHCYFAATDDTGEHYIMLLEQLEASGCSFRNASKHYSWQYLASMMEVFARLHAAFWNSTRFESDLAWVQAPQQHPIAAQLVQRALAEHAGAMPPVFSALAELYLAETDAIHRLWNRGVPTLVHGDAHDGNLFMDAGRPGLLDWALVARAPGMRDVGYFLAATLKPGDRDSQLVELLAVYRRALVEEGVASAPAEDQLLEELRWHAVYVWLGSVVTLAMGDAWQPANYVRAALGRLHDTLLALDCAGAIRRGIGPAA
ncbi:ecdysteroid 22-kinase family protein [Halieaceae bacterium]|nr:ecdysteroid 22-kinase family protein [Halieaceae bacterium]